MTKESDHRDGEAGDDEARGIGRNLPVRRNAGSLIRIRRHDRRKRRVWHVVDRVDHPEQDVRRPRINDLCARADIRRRERKNADDAKRHRCPQQPGSKLAPFRTCPIGNHTHHRIKASHCQADDEEERSCLRRRKPKGVGVEVELQRQHGLENKICRHVAESVSGLFANRQFLDHECLVVQLEFAFH